MISGVQSDPLAALSHEVRNLIATFVGFSELLLSQDWPPDKQREYLETMRDEGVRVSQFLNELLDLQRMEAGVSAPKKRPIDLAALLKFAAEVAGHDPKHPIELELQPDLPMALAEPDRIQQVLANLLSNARKYSPRGGTIHVTDRGECRRSWHRHSARVIRACLRQVLPRREPGPPRHSRHWSGAGHLPRDRRGARRLHPRRIGRSRAGRAGHLQPAILASANQTSTTEDLERGGTVILAR